MTMRCLHHSISVLMVIVLCLGSSLSLTRFATGGLGDERPASQDIQELISGVKGAVESKLGKTLDVYSAVTYRSQVVAGTNYFVKVKIGDNEYVHLRVFVPLPYLNASPSLAAVQEGKVESDPLIYFA